MRHFFSSRSFFSWLFFWIAFLTGFLIVLEASVSTSSWETWVPESGYLPSLFSKILVAGTSIGEVNDSEHLDAYSGWYFQKTISWTCPSWEWAVWVNIDNTLKCAWVSTPVYNCSSVGASDAALWNGCDMIFSSTGSRTWTVPAGVTSISAVAVGWGGWPACWWLACGWWWWALWWKNNIAVVPGQVLTIIVGDAGYNNGASGHQPEEDGWISAIHTSTWAKLLEVTGWKHSAVDGVWGSWGIIVVADGGWAWGDGWDYTSGVWAWWGGAWWYTWKGGRWAHSDGRAALAGNGGGWWWWWITVWGWSSAGGGGVGIYWAWTSWAAWSNAAAPLGWWGGSSGNPGYSGSATMPIDIHGNGWLYGWWAWGNSWERAHWSIGVVRIIWWAWRSFPSNAE